MHRVFTQYLFLSKIFFVNKWNILMRINFWSTLRIQTCLQHSNVKQDKRQLFQKYPSVYFLLIASRDHYKKLQGQEVLAPQLSLQPSLTTITNTASKMCYNGPWRISRCPPNSACQAWSLSIKNIWVMHTKVEFEMVLRMQTLMFSPYLQKPLGIEISYQDLNFHNWLS